MKIINTYKCEYCGEIFDDEDECLEHEKMHQLSSHGRTLFTFDYDKVPISKEKLPMMVNEVMYVIAKTSQAVLDFDDICKQFDGGDRITDFLDPEPGFYYYSIDDDCWKSLRAEEEKLAELRDWYDEYR